MEVHKVVVKEGVMKVVNMGEVVREEVKVVEVRVAMMVEETTVVEI